MSTPKIAKDLGLEGDGDDIELIEELEKIFDFELFNEEAENCQNVGDLFEIIKSKFSQKIRDEKKCFSAVVFYMLRRNLSQKFPDHAFCPNTNLRPIFKNETPYKFKKSSEQELSLRFPNLDFGIPQWLGVLISFSGPVMLILHILMIFQFSHIGIYVFTAIVVGGYSMNVDIGLKFGVQYSSMKNLVSEIVALNFGKLTKIYGYPGDKVMWKSYVKILQDQTGLYNTTITPETTFFPKV